MRILVVDDNQDAADTLAMLLDLWGHEVRVAYDGVAALALARQFRPQAALVDLHMPRLSGLEVARQLKRLAGDRTLRVIATSAQDPDDALGAPGDGPFDAYLVKPCDADRLREILTRRSCSPAA
jgi:CheY-like chemotaxis protein